MDFLSNGTYSISPLLQSTHYQFEGHATSGNWTDVGLSSGEGSDLKCLSQTIKGGQSVFLK